MQQYNCPLTISKCLEYQGYKKENSFCQMCQTNAFMEISSKIYSSPNFLIFLIERENSAQNLFNIPFIIEHQINIDLFLENKQTPSKFELRGILSISINENNKYVCFGKSPVDKRWYLYNDEIVGEFDENNVSGLYPTYIPSILVYKSCN